MGQQGHRSDHEADSKLLDSIVENIPDMIFVKDARELRFERVNRAGELLLGHSRADLLGKNDFDLFPREQAEFFQAKDRETLRDGVVIDIPEEMIETPQGLRWLHTKKIPILDHHGGPLYLLGISEDITERKRAAETLRDAHHQLEQRMIERTADLRRSEEQLRQAHKLEAVGRLAGGVAHDFNNMLTVIIAGAASLRAHVAGDPVLASAVTEILDAATHSARLTQQLLAFSRQQVLSPRDIELGKVVTGLQAMLRRLIGEDIDLHVHVDPEPEWIHADPGQLEQVIVNLAVNARDAMPNGGKLEVNVRTTTVAPPGAPTVPPGVRWVVLEVSDTGTGMDVETMSLIWEPFFTTKERGRGTGLGLATVHGIVSQSGGIITVRSAPDGSHFEAYFPTVPPVTTPAVAARLPRPARRAGETILLVEDGDAVRRAVRAVLVAAQYEVLEARDGIEALGVLEQHGPRITAMVSDLVMPRMGGRELVRQVAVRHPTLRVLFISGHEPPTSTAVRPRGDVALAEAFLVKPFTPEALVEALDALLEGLEPDAMPPDPTKR